DAKALGQQLGEDGADGRSEHDVEPAGNDGKHDVEGDAEPGNRVRPNVHLILCKEGTAERTHGRGQRRYFELFAGDVDPDGGGGIFILADGIERVAVHAAINTHPDVEPE